MCVKGKCLSYYTISDPWSYFNHEPFSNSLKSTKMYLVEELPWYWVSLSPNQDMIYQSVADRGALVVHFGEIKLKNINWLALDVSQRHENHIPLKYKFWRELLHHPHAEIQHPTQKISPNDKLEKNLWNYKDQQWQGMRSWEGFLCDIARFYVCKTLGKNI